MSDCGLRIEKIKPKISNPIPIDIRTEIKIFFLLIAVYGMQIQILKSEISNPKSEII